MSCWLRNATVEDIGDCDGPMDRMHLIPKQRIKRHLHGCDPMLVTQAVWHPAIWEMACRKHHADYDNHRFRVNRRNLRPETEHWALVMGMEWSLDRDFR